MEHGRSLYGIVAAVLDRIFDSLRRFATISHLIYWTRVIRAVIHFGFWRTLPIFIIRLLRPISAEAADVETALLAEVDAQALAREIRENSVAVGGILSPPCLNRLKWLADNLPVNHYQLMHRIDADVRLLTEDPVIKSVLRSYLKCEPVLLESTLVITGPHEVHGLNQQNSFHFDYAGWESLNVFVYLSDVTDESSCHVVIKGSHRHIEWQDKQRDFLSTREAEQRFGSSIYAIKGRAGTVFFENTEAFHRRLPGNERRAMLNLLYASHRSLLSHGRVEKKELEQRAKVYRGLRAAIE